MGGQAQDDRIKSMADRPGSTLKRFILWDYSRASWQYDVMVGLILAFIFLTPREVFRDYPRPKNVILVSTQGSQASYWIESAAVTGGDPAGRRLAVERLVHAQVDGKGQRVVKVEPVHDEEDEIRGYIAYTTR